MSDDGGVSLVYLMERAVSELRALTGVDIAFAASVDSVSGRLIVRCQEGNRTDGLLGLSAAPGRGLGWQSIERRRPVVAARHDHRAPARHRHAWSKIGEGIQAIFAVPVDVEAGERIVLYGAMRGTSQISAAAIDAASRVAALFEMYLGERQTGGTTTGLGLAQLCALRDSLHDIAELSTEPVVQKSIEDVVARLGRAYVAAPPRKPPSVFLTPRELEVLGLVAAGLSNAEVARRLNIEESTTKSHLARIMRRLQANNRTAAVRVAQELGLLR
ncbi:LuxR C-terminal-related transcriptional regulator [Frankia gtarii]|uniref:LuxR C-terminal-related transcriptional regulator n=1 Tax=Frankia gtarii TaxID=2950102 RepID=UPI0021C0743E|nr:LuxR C-terminal-related transcriptional regulator [Frankia gtarii]